MSFGRAFPSKLQLLHLDGAASSAGSAAAAAATADLVLLSGSLLHLDLCINFLLSPRCGGRRMLMRVIAATTLWGGASFAVHCHCSATPVSDLDTAPSYV